MAFSIGSGVSSQATMRPVLVRLISPASDSTSRCFITAGILIAKGRANSVIESASSRSSRARIARRVGSARAENVSVRWSTYLTFLLFNMCANYNR